MKRYIAFLLSMILMLGIVGCSQADKSTETAADPESIRIGVLTYNATDSEMIMFRSYLRDYLGDAFGVEYYYADTITSLEEEKAFIDRAKENGCQGVIAFTSNDLEAIVEYCGEDMYYALQNMTPTEEEFEALKKKPQFLGVVSPANEAEYEAGEEIARSLMGDTGDSSEVWLIFTGGSPYGNNMHMQRTKGMLDVLTAADYELCCSVEELLAAEAPQLAANGKDGGSIFICPGYPSVHTENVAQALAMCEADVIASCCSLETNLEQLRGYRDQLSKEVKIGLVDCFSEATAEAVAAGDIQYVSGKYAAMVAPSFVAMVNAVYGDMDLVKKNGEAYWIQQNMWSAGSEEEFMKLYSDSINIYDNIYTVDELMKRIGAYNSEAVYEDFLGMTEGK